MILFYSIKIHNKTEHKRYQEQILIKTILKNSLNDANPIFFRHEFYANLFILKLRMYLRIIKFVIAHKIGTVWGWYHKAQYRFDIDHDIYMNHYSKILLITPSFIFYSQPKVLICCINLPQILTPCMCVQDAKLPWLRGRLNIGFTITVGQPLD